ncbi:MAG: type II toxin-antitoxin system RelE/ParE family toxin, partial [Lachnospiraceae bacterium]|nr:type II toxin-antitoxin system RelE/ParE family toxin [Lachnospiraceae bacterium]
MIFDVQISEQANKDIREIIKYISVELLSPVSAARQLERFENAIKNLEYMP